MRALLYTFFIFLSAALFGQLEFHRSNDIPVMIDGEVLANAWAGGLNSSQWSTIDLNIDGVEDLFIFDRTSEQIQTYIKDPVTGDYDLAFGYAGLFPEISDWVLLRDFNCDGQKDIFTYTPGGIRVFENTSINGVLAFDLKDSLVHSYYDFGTDPYFSNLYVSNQDIPSIDDFDGDGDLDIHTFTLSGLTIEYHKNFASELGDCDSLAFELRNRCYGMIGEDAVSPTVYIGDEFIDGEFCTFNVVQPKSQEDKHSKDGVHSGSSICTFDYDGNGQRDLLLGDITARDMALIYIDDRGALQDSAIALEEAFPIDDVSVEMHVFHAGYFEDLDNDGIRDLMITPSNGTESEDKFSCWFYKNTGTNEDVDLQLQSDAFLQESMIDIGSISFARGLDHNADGLMDLILSNRGKYEDGGFYNETIWLLENTGTNTEPSFNVTTENFMGLNDLGLGDHLVPAFGDIDADGDVDMFLGDGSGKLHYFENQAGAGNPVLYSSFTTLLDDDGSLLDLGASLTPQLFDLDGDGLLDLIAGERNGNINFMKNIGSATNFDFELTEDTIGDIITDVDNNLIGYSAPWFHRFADGQVDVFIGNEEGSIFHLEDISTDVTETWAVLDSSAFDVFNGQRSSPYLFDFNNDDELDLLNGDQSGGIGLYMGGEPISALSEFGPSVNLSIFPNPVSGILNLSITQGLLLNGYKLYDISGRLVKSDRLNNRPEAQVDLSAQKKGIYLIEIKTSNGEITESLIKL